MRSCKGITLIVAGHHNHGPKLQAFGKVHGADRDVAAAGFDVFIENLERQPDSVTAARARSSCAVDRTKTPNSCGSTPALAFSAIQSPTVLISSLSFSREEIVGGGPLNTETVSLPVFPVAIHIRHHRAEQAIGLRADLVGRAVIDAQGAGSSPDVHAESFPGEGLLENALPKVTGEEQSIGPISTQGGEETAHGQC